MYSFYYLEPVCCSTGEGNGNSLQYSCLEKPVDRGAWLPAIYGVAQSWTRLKWFSMHACCTMSSSNCCFLTCIHISQEVGEVVWYPHLFQNFPQFVVIHTVKGFGIVNKVEIDVFLELSCFLIIQQMLAAWYLVPLLSLKPAWTSGSS